MPATETIADSESAADTDAREVDVTMLAETKPDASAGGTLLGSLTIPGRLKLVAMARTFTAMMLSDRFACAPDAVSLVSELVANSIRHSYSGRHGGTVTIALFDLGGGVRAEVADAGGRGTPALRGVTGHRALAASGQEAGGRRLGGRRPERQARKPGGRKPGSRIWPRRGAAFSSSRCSPRGGAGGALGRAPSPGLRWAGCDRAESPTVRRDWSKDPSLLKLVPHPRA